jgi:hypothetical protein
MVWLIFSFSFATLALLCGRKYVVDITMMCYPFHGDMFSRAKVILLRHRQILAYVELILPR